MQKLEVKKSKELKRFFFFFVFFPCTVAIWSQVPTLMPVICEEKVAGKSGEQGKERQEWETESRSPKRGWIPPHCWVYLSNEVSNVVNMDMFNGN